MASMYETDFFMASTHASLTMVDLRMALGLHDFNLWLEMTWPGADTITLPAMEKYRAARTALDNLPAVHQMLECTCKNDGLCRPCRAAARIRARQLPQEERM